MSSDKNCSGCKISKPIVLFTKNKTKPDGLNNYCKECQKNYRNNNKVKNKKYQKKYRQINKDSLKIKAKTYRINNKKIIGNRNKKYYQKNKEKILHYNKKWRRLHKDYIKNYKNNAYLKKYKNNIEYRILSALRSRIRIAMKNGKKCKRTEQLLGCSLKFFREYLESKFDNKMSWSNYGLRGWHIDHVKPCSGFNLTDPQQQKLCFHYTNLQPLWAIDNLKKSNKL